MARHDIVINKRCMWGHLSTPSTPLLPAWKSCAPKAVKAGGLLGPYPPPPPVSLPSQPQVGVLRVR